MKDRRERDGFQITEITTCDFSKLHSLSNHDVLLRARDKNPDPKLVAFLENKMGIKKRYQVPPELDALELAREALSQLVEKCPDLTSTADFLIYAGISNPLPTVCLSALLAGEFNFDQLSCWDIKSGCSSGLLALIQAQSWFDMGAKKGIIICSETLSKFSDPTILQMSAATGDGASAMLVECSDEWQIRGITHGTNGKYLKNMYVPGKFPVDIQQYKKEEYCFKLNERADALEILAQHWQNSLQELLDLSQIKGEQVNHYIAHQVDGSKNLQFALESGISQSAVAKNFTDYGNMGCPTIFINYKQWIERDNHSFKKGDHLLFHAVGGGISWAGLCLEKVR